MARAEKIEAVRAASLDARNVTPAFGAGVNVRIKSDPFENLDGLRYVNPRGNGPSDAERHPSAVTYAERMAELARITADTTGDRS